MFSTTYLLEEHPPSLSSSTAKEQRHPAATNATHAAAASAKMSVSDADSAISVGHDSVKSSNRKSFNPATHRISLAVGPSGDEYVPPLTEDEQVQQQQDNDEAIEQAETAIVVDTLGSYQPRDDFSDAGYETDSIDSSSTSLDSSSRQFVSENGMRYHKFREGAYNFPNDDTEQDREDMKHSMMMHLCQTLNFAPLDNPQRILDMGTGTGIWAIEMGDKYPSAQVLGVDLSPIQPSWVPPNVKFMVDDVESPWIHPRDHFDYVHSRHTVMAFKNWPRLLDNVYDHLKPGGWYEMQEIHHYPTSHDGTMPDDHPVHRYWQLIGEGLGNLGVDFSKTLTLKTLMEDAGFVNVTERTFYVPIGMWPQNQVLKTVGLYWRTILMDGLQPIALGPLTRGLKWTTAEVKEWLDIVKKAYMDGWVHSHMPLHVVYGQRPYDDSSI